MGIIFACGGVGGFVNCLLAGASRVMPGYDDQRNWHPGWIGNIILGATAAAVIWGIYGPSASYDLLGSEMVAPHLTVAQLLTSLVVGIGGSRVLTLETQKQILRLQRDAEVAAKEKVISATKTIVIDEKEN